MIPNKWSNGYINTNYLHKNVIQCTLSGTNFVYIVLVSKEIEAYNIILLRLFYLLQNELINLWVPNV